MHWVRFFFVISTFFAFITNCNLSQAKISYKDGTYEGEYSFVKVAVRIEKGEIEDIKIVHHGGGGQKYAEMVEPLLYEIVRKQSTDIDAITGATVSSINLKEAVKNALNKASIAQ